MATTEELRAVARQQVQREYEAMNRALVVCDLLLTDYGTEAERVVVQRLWRLLTTLATTNAVQDQAGQEVTG